MPPETATPVPAWAKFVGIVLALGTLGIAIPVTCYGALALVSVTVTRQVDLSASLEPGQRLVVSADQANLEVRPGPAGRVRVKVTDRAQVPVRGGLRRLQQETTTLRSMPDGEHLEVPNARGSDVILDWNTTVTVQAPIDTPLEVAAGAVTAQGLTGSFQITADRGPVSLRDMTVAGSSSVHTTVDTVEFSGLVRMGSLKLSSDAGGVQVRLDSQSDARIDAQNPFGSITADPRLRLAIHGGHGSGVIGAGTGLVTLRSSLGAIRIDFE
jgi:hypothetical protein